MEKITGSLYCFLYKTSVDFVLSAVMCIHTVVCQQMDTLGILIVDVVQRYLFSGPPLVL